MESVRINSVSVLSGLHLEKLQELGTRKTDRNGEVSLLSTRVSVKRGSTVQEIAP